MVITPKLPSVARVTVALAPIDVELLDRLAQLSGTNRSEELRGILSQLRPMLRSTIEAFEAVARQREQLESAAATLRADELESLLPELERLQNVYLGTMARVEGMATASERFDDAEPPSSNTGVTPPPPSPTEPPQ